jgi:predicted GH43/DUF377 family glycosyl hydrolase
VVFPCGYTVAPDGDTIQLYYGAADTSIGLASGSVRAMLEWLNQHGIETSETSDKQRSVYGS